MATAKVLIAEDEEHMRNAVALILENEGYEVLKAADGKEALHMVLQSREGESPIDLLILDIEMPGLTGIQLLDALHDRGGRTPTILMTRLADVSIRECVRNAGYIELLQKPFDPKALTVAVKRALGRETIA
jgi:DNA-binding response OmpR family regulator